MSNEIREMVEDASSHPDVRTARNMPDAANSDQSLLGYAAVNDAGNEVARLAFEFYQERQAKGIEGSADDDWFRAEQEVQRRNYPFDALERP